MSIVDEAFWAEMAAKALLTKEDVRAVCLRVRVEYQMKEPRSENKTKVLLRIGADRELRNIVEEFSTVDTQADVEMLKSVYDDVMGPNDLVLEGLWQLRIWDGVDGTWIDVTAAVTPHEALRKWLQVTYVGTRNTKFDDIDYYRIFPATTTMAWSEGREMHRGDAPLPESPPVPLLRTRRPRTRWDFDFALHLVGALEKELSAVGWHIGIAGSVLHKGESAKDLDVVVFPRTTAEADKDAARKVFESFGMKLSVPVEQVHKVWREKGSNDEKHVELWDWHGKRIDVFFLR